MGRWWIPGQHEAGGETYPWDNYVPPRCHHPLRMGNRLYVSYWHHGMFILDIEDMARPRLVSQFNTGPAHPHPTHTALPIPLLKGRQILVVADEDVAAAAVAAGLHLVLRHHGRAPAHADLHLPGRRRGP